MGMIGKYLDQLKEVERDRVIVGQGWCSGEYFDGENHCLVGHVVQYGGDFDHMAWHRSIEWCVDPSTGKREPYAQFDRLVDRIGLDRAVQLVKARAAARNRVVLPEKRRSTVEV